MLGKPRENLRKIEGFVGKLCWLWIDFYAGPRRLLIARGLFFQMPSRKTKGVPGKCSLPSDYFLKSSGNFVVFGGSLVGVYVGIQWEEPESAGMMAE